MDMSFATQALACAWMATQKEKLPPAVYEVTDEIENQVSTLKLASMGLTIDTLTKEQQEYLTGWQEGT
jgi:adenosylhomocysteinase